MQRIPKQLIGNTLVTASAATYYTTPANTKTTISSFLANNTTATPRTLTVNIVPTGGSAAASNQVATTITIPAAGAAPTQLPALIAQTMEAGGFISMVADVASAITVLASGYETTV